jgi:hypothetical protein
VATALLRKKKRKEIQVGRVLFQGLKSTIVDPK